MVQHQPQAHGDQFCSQGFPSDTGQPPSMELFFPSGLALLWSLFTGMWLVITCRVAFLDESHTPKCWTSYFAHSRYLLIITMSYIGLGVHYLQSTIIRYIAILLIHQCQEAGIIFISSREEETGLKKERIAQGHSASCLQMTSFFLLAWLTDWMNVT